MLKAQSWKLKAHINGKTKNAVGRRKEAVTRVFISKGEGKITINDKDYKEYFALAYLQNQVASPMKAIEASDKFDVKSMQQVVVLKARQRLPNLALPVPCSRLILNTALY